MYVGLPENLTTIGSEIQFFCGNQTNQKFKGKPCVDNSLWREFMGHAWSPDIKSGHIKCAADRKSTDGKLNNNIIASCMVCINSALPQCI